jgi:hypothetical protein
MPGRRKKKLDNLSTSRKGADDLVESVASQ